MRFQAEIPKRDAAILERLSRELEVQSNAELLSNLIGVAAWIVSERRRGNRLAAIGPSGEQKELVVPMFERVAPEEFPTVRLHLSTEAFDDLQAVLERPPEPASPNLKRLMRKNHH